jgi:hypothetical protein
MASRIQHVSIYPCLSNSTDLSGCRSALLAPSSKNYKIQPSSLMMDCFVYNRVWPETVYSSGPVCSTKLPKRLLAPCTNSVTLLQGILQSTAYIE